MKPGHHPKLTRADNMLIYMSLQRAPLSCKERGRRLFKESVLLNDEYYTLTEFFTGKFKPNSGYPVKSAKGQNINVCSIKKPPFRPYGHLSPIGGKATILIPVVEELGGFSPSVAPKDMR